MCGVRLCLRCVRCTYFAVEIVSLHSTDILCPVEVTELVEVFL